MSLLLFRNLRVWLLTDVTVIIQQVNIAEGEAMHMFAFDAMRYYAVFQLVGGEFDLETNFVIQDPENILQMLNVLSSCSEKLQVSSCTQ